MKWKTMTSMGVENMECHFDKIDVAGLHSSDHKFYNFTELYEIWLNVHMQTVFSNLKK